MFSTINDMIDEDINYILQINKSVPPESRHCVLVAFASLHVYIFTNIDICFRF
jgi:hypothetical protein